MLWSGEVGERKRLGKFLYLSEYCNIVFNLGQTDRFLASSDRFGVFTPTVTGVREANEHLVRLFPYLAIEVLRFRKRKRPLIFGHITVSFAVVRYFEWVY